MKVRVSDLITASEIMPRLTGADLGAKGLYAVTKAFKAITNELQDVEKVRQKLLEQYAQKDDKGRTLEIGGEAAFKSPEDRKAFLDEYAAIRDGEVEINVQAIPWRYLLGKTYRPVPADFVALGFMLKDPDEKEIEELDKLMKEKEANNPTGR